MLAYDAQLLHQLDAIRSVVLSRFVCCYWTPSLLIRARQTIYDLGLPCPSPPYLAGPPLCLCYCAIFTFFGFTTNQHFRIISPMLLVLAAPRESSSSMEPTERAWAAQRSSSPGLSKPTRPLLPSKVSRSIPAPSGLRFSSMPRP